MNILHVVQSLDPAWGGIARVLPMLATELVKSGQTCRIAALAGGRYGTPPDVPGVEILRFAAPNGSRLGKSPEFADRIDELTQRADVVHLHGLWTAQNWDAGKTARKLGTPYIMTPHSMMMPWAWRRRRWKKLPAGWLFEHANLRGAAMLHALAEGEAKAMRELGFNDRIEVIPNGLHVAEFDHLPPADGLEARFPALKDRRLLVFIGRIHPQKGIVQAMQGAFDTFAAAKDWHFVVAGPDEIGMQKMLAAAVGRKKMTDRVTFTGLLGREEVRALLGRAGVLLQPSMSEGLSMSIVEALAAGVPVVISEACNMPEVEEHGAGRIVEAHRSAISQALKPIVSSDQVRAEMGGRARALARERFDWGKLVPRYNGLYGSAAGS